MAVISCWFCHISLFHFQTRRIANMTISSPDTAWYIPDVLSTNNQSVAEIIDLYVFTCYVTFSYFIPTVNEMCP